MDDIDIDTWEGEGGTVSPFSLFRAAYLLSIAFGLWAMAM